MSNLSLKVLIIDDHTLFRAGLRRLLLDHPSVEDVQEVGDGTSGINHLLENETDVVIVDLAMPGLSGRELVAKIMRVASSVRVVVLTGITDDHLGRQLLSLGVDGYLTKDCRVEEMMDALSRVFSKQPYLSGEVARRLAIANAMATTGNPFDRLTDREMQITMKLLEGKRNRQIGILLFISEKTVSSHRTRAFSKLGVSSTAELARLALKHGFWPEAQH